VEIVDGTCGLPSTNADKVSFAGSGWLLAILSSGAGLKTEAPQRHFPQYAFRFDYL
jgi:hypothetical protein